MRVLILRRRRDRRVDRLLPQSPRVQAVVIERTGVACARPQVRRLPGARLVRRQSAGPARAPQLRAARRLAEDLGAIGAIAASTLMAATRAHRTSSAAPPTPLSSGWRRTWSWIAAWRDRYHASSPRRVHGGPDARGAGAGRGVAARRGHGCGGRKSAARPRRGVAGETVEGDAVVIAMARVALATRWLPLPPCSA